MDLRCYLYQGWAPRIRPAEMRRDWMDASPASFAYRCLPLGMANAHGWEVLCPVGFSAMWNGGSAPEDVSLRVDGTVEPSGAPEALFGLGTFTLHVCGILRTEPGWNLWVSGPPNSFKDGVAPLSGLIETDWSPFTFTMNWRLTRPHHWVRFEANEPFAFFFPVERNRIEAVTPRCLPIEREPGLKNRFEDWSASRDAFQRQVTDNPPVRPSESWQKFYYRGIDASGCPGASDHRTKLRIAPFANAPAIPESPAPAAAPVSPLAKRDWILTMMERQRRLSSEASAIYRVEGVDGQAFLDDFYATNRPVVLCGELKDWPALHKWSREYLRERIGDATIECQSGRTDNVRFERDKDRHRSTMRFADYLDLVAREPGNGAYITAYNHSSNAGELAPLFGDLGSLDKFMDPDTDHPHGMMWIGPAGTFTPLHHDLTNNFLIQVIGRKRVLLASPGETPRLYNDEHVFSAIADLDGPDFTLERFPLAEALATHVVDLAPGEILFIPVGWWHQVRALDFSVSLTQTHFRWPNDAWQFYPQAR